MAQKRNRSEFERPPATFALYGRALPPLDGATRDDGSYVPIWKQEAVDDRGRKRLHGAFTGGFSAGFARFFLSPLGRCCMCVRKLTYVGQQGTTIPSGRRKVGTQPLPLAVVVTAG